MPGQTLNTLTQRLDRLERENRRWKVLGTAVVAVLGLVLFLGATGSKVADEVRAKRFVLMDDNGNMRAQLVTDQEDTHLFLWDQAGKSMANISVRPSGLSLALDYAPKGFSAWHSEKMERYKSKKSPEEVFKCGVVGVGKYTLLLRTQDWRPVLPERGVQSELVFAEGGCKRIWLQRTSGKSSVALFDQDENTRAVLGNTELQKTRTGTVEQRSASSLVLFDKDGKVIWKAPSGG